MYTGQKRVYEGNHTSEPYAYQQAEVGFFSLKGDWYSTDTVVRDQAVLCQASNRRPASRFRFDPNMRSCTNSASYYFSN